MHLTKYQLTQALCYSSVAARSRRPGKQPKASSAPPDTDGEGGWEAGGIVKDNSIACPFLSQQQGYQSSHSNRGGMVVASLGDGYQLVKPQGPVTEIPRPH